MPKRLLIVESPTKAKTINRYVGKDYTVKASVGHIKDLPKTRMGVDVDKDFAVELEVIRGKKKVLTELRRAAKNAQEVFLAPDPDREGEAIAWHIAEEISQVNPKVYRVTFNEITRKAVCEAMERPRPLDRNLYQAQQARRVLDRLVGYELSPLLWEKVRRGLSAGRVQSVAVRLVVEREQEIEAFTPQEYWSIEETLQAASSETAPFVAHLFKIQGEKAEVPNAQAAADIRAALERSEHVVADVERSERQRRPGPPFITSKLQQAAAAALRFSAKKTMSLAQQLYEGVEIGGEGMVGLITYMRTDSIRVASEAIAALRDYIKESFGADFLPDSPNFYKSKSDAQDAHEAIRPTDVSFTPERIKASLTADQLKLYDLIWRQFVSSQMSPARYDRTSITVMAGPYEMRATGSICTFPGFLKVSGNGKEEDEDVLLPNLEQGMPLKLVTVEPTQHFTQPPPRFSEGTLIKELEERGIGRPSTYATILDTIQSKGYVDKREGRLHPTDLGRLVTELLVESFPDILDVDFTATMERKLDEVEEGTVDWLQLMREFYTPFASALATAHDQMRDVKREEIPTDHTCDLCGAVMMIRWGRNGFFLSCSNYPTCKNTREIKSRRGNTVEVLAPEETHEVCDKCGRPMNIRRGRFGRFLACSGYPECKNSRSISTGVTCPQCKQGQLVEKRSRRGRLFFACNRYPTCTLSTWYQPISETCPTCGYGMLVWKETKRDGRMLACPVKGCGYKRASDPESD
jgi:DNA topoisomerase-1